MSTAALGDLVVRLSADIASFEGAMTRAEMLTAKTAEGIENAMDRATDSVKKLAEAYVGFEAIKAFAEHVDEATKFASSLELLSQRLGISVEDMSAFKNIAEKSGTSLQTVAQGMATLQRSMYEMMQGTGRAKIVFESLNLSVTNNNGTLKSAKQFFEELSAKIAGLGSATERSAAAQKVMRGVGSELLPMMLALAQGGELETLVTTKQAVAAKHYTDSLVDMHEVQEKFFLMVSSQVTPVMEAAVRAYTDLATQTGSLSDRTKQLTAQNQIRAWAIEAGIGIAMVIDGFRYVAVGIQIVIDAIKILANAAITGFEIIVGTIATAFASLQDLGTLMRGVVEIFAGDFVTGAQDVKLAIDSMKNGWGGFFDDAKKKAQGLAANVDGLAGDIEKLMEGFKQGAASEAFLRALDAINNRIETTKKGAGGAGDVLKEFKVGAVDKLLESLDKQKAKLDAELFSWREYGRAAEDVTEAETRAKLNEDSWIQTINRLAKERKAAGETIADWIHRVQTQIIETAQAIDQEKVLLAAVQAYRTELAAQLKTIDDAVDKQRESNATMGLGVTAVTDYNLALAEERLALAKVIPDNNLVVAALNAQIDAYHRLRTAQIQGKELQDSINSWKDLSQIIGSTASSMIMNWGHAVQALRDMFKSLLADMIKIFMQKWVLNMVANVVGGNSQLGMSLLNAANEAGKGTFVGNVYDYFAGQSNVSQFGPPDTPGGYSDTYFNNPSAQTPGYGGYAMAGIGGAVAGYGIGSVAGQLWGNNRNQTGMAVGGLIGGAAGGIAGTALGVAGGAIAGAEIGSVVPIIGTIIGAVIGALIGGLFKSGGAEKQQGSFEGAFTGTTQGATLQGGALPSTTTDLFSGSNQNAAVAQKITQSIADLFYQTAYTLGGKHVAGMQFGLGFSMDPGGTAPGMIHNVVRDASGNVIYQHNDDNAPRDDTQFQAEVSLEAERSLIAGLQHVDLGADMNKLFGDFGDVVSATKDDMDALLAKAADLKGAIDIINAVGQGAHAITLTVDDLKGYQQAGESLAATANRVGGAWISLVGAFEDPMEKLNNEKSNLASLYGTLQASGYQIPKSRADWLKLMQGIDQSTEAGRTLFLQMLQLAPSFADVSDAAAAMMDQFDALMGRERSGYTTGRQQLALSGDLSQFMANNAWTKGLSPGQVLEALHTISREDFSHYDTATQQLILAILGLDDTISAADKPPPAPPNPVYTSDSYDAFLAKYNNEIADKYGGVIGASPDHSTQFTNQINISKDLIKEFKERQAAIEAASNGNALPQEWYALQTAINNLDASLPGLSRKLAAVTILEAQYGKEKGDQLFDLQEWYDQQKALVGDNQAALLALEKEYQDKKNAIITGGNADGLQSWQQNIQAFLNSLLTNQQLSPLSLQDQLAAARDTYEKTLAAANGGDTTAQGQLQAAAEAYLNIARMLGASGPIYNDIFRTVYDELAKASKAPSYEQRMTAVLPDSGKLASSGDMAKLNDSVNGLAEVLLKGISVSDPEVTALLQKIVAATGSGNGKGLFV